MRSNWRKQMMISALALTLSATNVAPVFASAAPDGKTNAADIAQTMGTTAQWNRWEKEWETLKMTGHKFHYHQEAMQQS